ncbi:hypothetical protein CRENBAI_015434 [Crenichthys baileyi]|uniref:Uncharacterized protein n=1 Tax=Crenichthys baileyi TaxID=28760 RepID=A0AAV9S4M0_9TELE
MFVMQGDQDGRVEERTGVIDCKERKNRPWSWGGSAGDLPSINLTSFSGAPPLPVSLESCEICCHTLFLQTAPTMYLTVQYCAKLASHDNILFYIHDIIVLIYL